MHLYATRVFKRGVIAARGPRGPVSMNAGTRQSGQKLRATAALMLGLIAGVPSGLAQQAATPDPPQNKAASTLPSAPTPTPTQPLDLRQSKRDFSARRMPAGLALGNVYAHADSRGQFHQLRAAI